MRLGLRVLGVVAFAAGLGAGCQASELDEPNPAPVPGDTLIADQDAGSADAPDAGERRRTVTTRNPLGGPPGNLLVDGDFELSATTRSWAQTAWYSIHLTDGWRRMRFETGGLCRSGLRCARLDSQVALYGQGTSAAGEAMVASVWAKVPEGDACSILTAATYVCNTGGSQRALAPRTSQPDPSGWCVYETEVRESHLATCLYVDSDVLAPRYVLVDSAQLLPADGTTPMASRSAPEIAPEQRARIRAGAEWIQKRRRFGPAQAGPAPGL